MTSMLLLLLVVLMLWSAQATKAPTDTPTAAPTTGAPTTTKLVYTKSPSASPTTVPPTSYATVTHDPDWTEGQLIAVIVGSLVGFLAVTIAIYCAYARGCCSDGQVLVQHKKVEHVTPMHHHTSGHYEVHTSSSSSSSSRGGGGGGGGAAHGKDVESGDGHAHATTAHATSTSEHSPLLPGAGSHNIIGKV